MKKISLFIIGIFCLGLLFSCENLFNGSKDNDGEPVKKSEYTVTLDTNGGTPLEPMVIKAGAKCYVPYATIKSGHNFTGWYYNGRLWDFKNDTVNEDITLIAGWEIINYNITYDLRGGSYDGEMPESYNVNSSDIPLGTPVREDYVFLGWEINGRQATEIKASSAADVTVVATWFGLEAEITPAKGGAKGIVSIIHDDAKLNTMALMDSMLEKYGLVADVGFLLNTIYSNSTINYDALAKYSSYIGNGRWKIVNHSATHTWWGDEINGGTSYSYVRDNPDRLSYEVVTSQQKMRELFPGQRVLTFAFPGFSAVTNEYTDGSLYQLKQIVYSPAARELINNNYIGARFYGGGSNELSGDIDWGWVNTRFLTANMIKNNLNSILTNAAKKGTMEVISLHSVTDDPAQNEKDPSYYLMNTDMDLALSKINSFVDQGKLWNANFEDALLYTREAKAATLNFRRSGENVVINLTDNLPDDIYNTPLTLRLKNYGEWHAARVTQGDTVQYITPKTENGETFLQFELTPDKGTATISPVYPEDIPE